MSYQGYPSWEHWEVTLQVGNDEYLYNRLRSQTKEEFADYLTGQTLGEVEVTKELAQYAWDAWQDQ